MNNDRSMFIRATMNSSLENIKQTGLPINSLSQVKIDISKNSVDYNIGGFKEEIVLYVIANNASKAEDDNFIKKKQDNLIRDAKMVALCLAYLPHYDKGSREEQLFANEWRRLEREINFHELNEMQNDFQ